MGADIHSYIERFDGDRWSWDREAVFDEGARRPWEPFDRSYALFGFLAGVRDRDVPQIHPCRGLPADLSPELRKEFGFTFPDDCTHYPADHTGRRYCSCVYHHSGLFGHSWATGAELLTFDYGTTFACPLRHASDEPTPPAWAVWCARTDGLISVAEYLGGWVDRFREIAALTEDPRHVRTVFAFDN